MENGECIAKEKHRKFNSIEWIEEEGNGGKDKQIENGNTKERKEQRISFSSIKPQWKAKEKNSSNIQNNQTKLNLPFCFGCLRENVCNHFNSDKNSGEAVNDFMHALNFTLYVWVVNGKDFLFFLFFSINFIKYYTFYKRTNTSFASITTNSFELRFCCKQELLGMEKNVEKKPRSK